MYLVSKNYKMLRKTSLLTKKISSFYVRSHLSIIIGLFKNNQEMTIVYQKKNLYLSITIKS